MALELNYKNNIYEVSGKLNAENTIALKKHFEQFLTEVDYLILSLDNVKVMAPSSAFTIEQLYLDFIKDRNGFQIIGIENKNIAMVMKDTKTSYILSNDRS